MINTVEFNKKNSDYFAALVANRILGGGGAGRLFNNLREDKGWTYGSYSGISESYKTKGLVIAQAQVRNEVTDSAAVELLMELDKMKNTYVLDEELNSAKAKYTGNFVLSLENPSTIAGVARNIITQDLPEDYYNSFLENINSVTKEDVQKVIKVLLDNAAKAKNMIKNLIDNFEKHIDPNDPTNNCLDVAIITAPEKRSKKTIEKLNTVAGRVLNKK